MKTTRKFMAILMVLAMVLSMGVLGAFAAENSITITGKTGHTYEAYQIFVGDLSAGVLSNIEWGTGVSEAGQTALGDAADIADNLTDDNIKDFQEDVAQYLINPKALNETDGTYTLTGLDAGYYLVKDKDNTQDIENGAYTAYILKVVGNVEVTAKSDVPTVDKSVDGEEKNATDVSIGDTVTFTLTATMPSTFDGYDEYQVVFHDTMSAGLDFVEDSVKVTIDGNEMSTGYIVDEQDGVLTITFDDVLALGATESSKIIVTYNAVVDSDAVIGATGNSNTVKLEYSNDPNWDGDGDKPTGDTPEDKVLVFTYELDVTKVDGVDNTAKLSGAEFVLSRDNASGKTEYAVVNDAGTLTGWTENKAEASTLTSDSNGLFKVAGLDAGKYQLEETKAPAGYNLLDTPINIEIAAELDTDDDEAALNALSIKIDDNAFVSGNVNTGIVNAKVTNNAGSTLPETGAMGTVIFIAVGSLIAVAAVCFLVTKKRMQNRGMN